MAKRITLFTIGFTKKSAEQFFTKLQAAGVSRVLDVRLNNRSQLAGFAKKDDLAFFLRSIAGIDYAHIPDLAPTQDMLGEYQKSSNGWAAYEVKFLDLIRSRRIEETVRPELLDGGCLLCSEDRPHHCHRRLVAEYLCEKWGDLEIKHLT
ncbi:DUF488 family protein [Fimbriiglobus ruber]|uniref:DUF488 domain-containing protein n=1 Tax=Fimbriiglobus ruber TaxID=1908690 RepID=A0A225DZV8_9BACT|nr:DUF488 domain-containing protein [Fimbriiglobus ruber]OWK46871.1 hypothetical protein FRUB_00570 [Fimbriiglobus ruber]